MQQSAELDHFAQLLLIASRLYMVGPAHAHPHGEVDMIMPLDGDAKFDGRGAGWLVYPAGSRHAPTVTEGKALVLYLLPEGAIDFKPEAGS
jgi:Domain of unknown function (DUF4863)